MKSSQICCCCNVIFVDKASSRDVIDGDDIPLLGSYDTHGMRWVTTLCILSPSPYRQLRYCIQKNDFNIKFKFSITKPVYLLFYSQYKNAREGFVIQNLI